MNTSNQEPRNHHHQKHGYWVDYYKDGTISYSGNYDCGTKIGYHEDYYVFTDVRYKTYYII